jgi:hypothetical protein
MERMTRRQHFIALLLLLPGIPFALPLGLLVVFFKYGHIAAEWLYETLSIPFLWVNRLWAIRCERVNRAP